MVYWLKQNGFSALHVVCAGLTDVVLDGQNLIVTTSEDYSYNFICQDNNKNFVQRALNWQDTGLSFVIQKSQKIQDKKLQDLQKLKQYVDEQFLTIKGE